MSGTISLFSIVFSGVAFVTSLVAIVLVLAQRFSSHKIEWKALETSPVKEEEEIKLDEVEDDFLNNALNLQRKKKKKEEDPMDEIFATSNF